LSDLYNKLYYIGIILHIRPGRTNVVDN